MHLCKLSLPKKDFRIKRKNLSVYNFFLNPNLLSFTFFLASCRNDPGYKNLFFSKEKFVQQTMPSWNVFWFETKNFCTLFSFFKSKFCCCSFFLFGIFFKVPQEFYHKNRHNYFSGRQRNVFAQKMTPFSVASSKRNSHFSRTFSINQNLVLQFLCFLKH